MPKSKFIPIHELVALPVDKLSSAQRKVVNAHNDAVSALADFKKTSAMRSIGITQPMNEPIKITEEEHLAYGRSAYALTTAIRYYHSHGKLDEAFADLYHFAKQHWHPVMHEMYEHKFDKSLQDAEIKPTHEMVASLVAGKARFLRSLQSDVALIHSEKKSKKPLN